MILYETFAGLIVVNRLISIALDQALSLDILWRTQLLQIDIVQICAVQYRELTGLRYGVIRVQRSFYQLEINDELI